MATSPNPFLSAPMGGGVPRPLLEPGTKLDKFVIQRHIGSGGLADVYLARDEVSGSDVALKVVFVGPCGGDVAEIRLKREKAAYDKIQDHRHVIKVHDIFLAPYAATQLLLLSMEYADGGSFEKWLVLNQDNWQLRKSTGIEYFKQLCMGAAACIDAGVIHLDLKPGNALLVNNVLKVADFNLSRIVQNLTASHASAPQLAFLDAAFGTPMYKSPQHWTAAHPDELGPRSVVYSLGVILYETLHPHGRPPFGGDVLRLRELHLNAPPPALPDASEAEARVVKRCLEKDPERRYATPYELIDDLEGRLPQGTSAGQSVSAVHTQAWQEVRRAMEAGHLEDAYQLCRKLLDECPAHEAAAELHKELVERRGRAGDLLAAAREGLGKQGLDELYALLAEAEEVYLDHPARYAARGAVDWRSQEYGEAIRKCIAHMDQYLYHAAHAFLEAARLLSPGCCERERKARVLAPAVERAVADDVARERAVRNGDEAEARRIFAGTRRHWSEVRLAL